MRNSVRHLLRTLFLLALPAALLSGCGEEQQKAPDVSGITVELILQRFDRDFFSMDTTNMTASLQRLQQQYPEFFNDFIYNILGAYPQPDSMAAQVRYFIRDYTPVYAACGNMFTLTAAMEQDIRRGLQYVRHYFPGYAIPQRIITFVGPLEGYANVLTSSGLAVGLQLYLGGTNTLYQTDYIRAVYPEYQSRRFEPAYIPVNCIKNIIDDLYPATEQGLPLAYEMVEAGKRLYLLDQLLPETPDSLLIGYTSQQLKGCYDNEGLIWGFFLQNNLLYETDPALTRDYLTDGPRTEVLGQDSPGFIAQFTGWRIVQKWMKEHSATTLQQLLQTPAKTIFEESKYKPK